jgi:hypothetical protein
MKINNQKNHMLLLDTYSKHNRLGEEDQQLIKEKMILIKELPNSGMTLAAQTITMQEHIISLIPTIRKIASNYNPNMIAFIPENPKPTIDISVFAERLKTHIPNDFSLGTPNSQTEEIIRKTLPMYLEYKRPDLSLMSQTERDYCIAIINKYAPEYLLTL